MKSNSLPGRIVLSSFFLFFYMAMAIWGVFLNPYLEKNGYSGTEIGLIGGAFQGSIFLVTPVMGLLSDKFGVKKIIIVLLISAISLLILYSRIHIFIVLFFFTLILAASTQPVGALIDSIAISFVRNTGNSSYGRYRLWGSIGWALSTFLTGLIISPNNISVIFYLSAGVFLLMLFSIIIYPIDKTCSSITKYSKEQLKYLFRNKTIILFSFLLLLYGIALAPLNNFMNLYFLDIGASYEILGRAFSLQAATEIPFFLYGIYFVKKFGAEKSIILSMIVTLIRMSLYSFVTNPEIAVWIGLGQGFTFSIFLVAVVEFFHNLIPENMRATGQSLIWAFHFGAGVTLGNILIGYLYEFTPMIHVMKIMGILILISMFLFLLFFRKNRCEQS